MRITEQAIIRATDRTSLELLLHRRGNKVLISQETFSKIISNHQSLDMVKYVIEYFDFSPDVLFAERLFRAAACSFDILQYFIQATGPKPMIFLSEEILATAIYFLPEALQWFFREFGSTVPLSENVLVAAISRNSSSLDWILREHPLETDLTQLWKAIWKVDGKCIRLSFGSRVPNIRRMAAITMLEYTRRVVDVSEEVFEQASTVEEGERFFSGEIVMSNAFEDLSIICLQYGLPMPMTERMKKLVLERSDADRIDSLIQFHIYDDEESLNIKTNECATDGELISFLTERMDKG